MKPSSSLLAHQGSDDDSTSAEVLRNTSVPLPAARSPITADSDKYFNKSTNEPSVSAGKIRNSAPELSSISRATRDKNATFEKGEQSRAGTTPLNVSPVANAEDNGAYGSLRGYCVPPDVDADVDREVMAALRMMKQEKKSKLVPIDKIRLDPSASTLPPVRKAQTSYGIRDKKAGSAISLSASTSALLEVGGTRLGNKKSMKRPLSLSPLT